MAWRGVYLLAQRAHIFPVSIIAYNSSRRSIPLLQALQICHQSSCVGSVERCHIGHLYSGLQRLRMRDPRLEIGRIIDVSVPGDSLAAGKVRQVGSDLPWASVPLMVWQRTQAACLKTSRPCDASASSGLGRRFQLCRRARR